MKMEMKTGALYVTNVRQYAFPLTSNTIEDDRIPMETDQIYLYLGTFENFNKKHKMLNNWLCFLHNETILCAYPDFERFEKVTWDV